MKSGKAADNTTINIEVLEASGYEEIRMVTE